MKITISDFSVPLFFQFFDDEYRTYVADVWILLETILVHRMNNLSYETLRIYADEYESNQRKLWKNKNVYSIYCYNILKILNKYTFLQEDFLLYNSSEKISWNVFAKLLCKGVPKWNEKEGMYVFYSIYSGKFSGDLFIVSLIHDIQFHELWRELRK